MALRRRRQVVFLTGEPGIGKTALMDAVLEEEAAVVAKMLVESKEYANHLVGSHPIGRIAKANEISDAVVWLCSDRSSYLVGAALPLDGGYTAQ